MEARFVLRLIVVVVFVVPPGCGGWRVGEPSPHRAMAQGRITGPAPALLTIDHGAGGWGTVTPLADGSLLTAAHVFRRFGLEIDGQHIHSLDVVKRGDGGKPGTEDVFLRDWIHFRAAPFEHPGWPVSARRPKVGETLIIRGFVRAAEQSVLPVLAEVRAQIREPPRWIDDSQHHLIYAEPADSASNIAFAGMSGGPVLLKDASTGKETLVGIFSGRMTAKWLIFHKWVWVIQPWPPCEANP